MSLLLLAACPQDSEPDDSDSGGTDPNTTYEFPEAPLPTEIAGSILVRELPLYDYATVGAEIWAAPLPTTQEVVATEGDCTLLDGPTMNDWDCDPACDYGSEACIDGSCVDYPARAPAGDIRVQGLAGGELVLEESGGFYASPTVDPDLFDAGDPIRIASPGGDTPALDLSALGVETLSADLESLDFETGEPLALSWEPPGSGQPSRIRLVLETGWHGANSLTTIWCETEDDGELTVPASLTAEFDVPSCGECEQSELQRFTRDLVDFGAGPVELLVVSELDFVPWW